jgi:hypothetical protein
LLAACSGPDQRAQRVIDYAVGKYRAERGWLFGVRDGELALLARFGEHEPPSALATALRTRITNMLEAQRTLTLEAQPELDALSAYTVIPLALEARAQESERRVLGAIVLSGVSIHAESVSDHFAQRFAEMLHASADVSTLRVDD